jgi:predicted TIM-barrel fold metal-dependent hydrolase
MSRPLPDGIIDPHIHQWDPFSTPSRVAREARLLRRVQRIPRWIARLQPQANREFVGEPHHVLKPYLPGDYRRDAGSLPVSSVVHIEASYPAPQHLDTVDETRWVTSLPWQRDGAPQLAALVVHVDPRWTDAAAVLDAHLEASDRVRGVRCSGANHPDRGVLSFSDRPHLLADPDFVRGFAAIAERGLSFEVWVHAHQLPDAVALATEYPQTTFVFDHYATPVGIFGPRGRSTGRTARERVDLLARWRDDVAALAQLPNVVAKHSGLGMPMLGASPRRPITPATVGEVLDRCAPLIRHVHEVFGAQRTMWASNFPIDKPVHTIPASLELVTSALGSDADLDLLLRDVARRTYRLA